MQRRHAATVQLRTSARLGIEMVLPFAAHQDLAVLGDLEAFCVGFCSLHDNFEYLISNLEKQKIYNIESLIICPCSVFGIFRS